MNERPERGLMILAAKRSFVRRKIGRGMTVCDEEGARLLKDGAPPQFLN
jgi:hypothetical protein